MKSGSLGGGALVPRAASSSVACFDQLAELLGGPAHVGVTTLGGLAEGGDDVLLGVVVRQAQQLPRPLQRHQIRGQQVPELLAPLLFEPLGVPPVALADEPDATPPRAEGLERPPQRARTPL